MCVCVCVCVCARAHVCSVMSDSFETLWTVAHQAVLSMGFPRQEYWSGLTFPPPKTLSTQKLNLVCCICCTGSSILYHWDTSEATLLIRDQISPDFKMGRKFKVFFTLKLTLVFSRGSWDFPGGTVVKNLPLSHRVQSLGQEVPLEK